MSDVMDSVLDMLQNATNEMARLNAEIARLRAENERLRSENKNLLDAMTVAGDLLMAGNSQGAFQTLLLATAAALKGDSDA